METVLALYSIGKQLVTTFCSIYAVDRFLDYKPNWSYGITMCIYVVLVKPCINYESMTQIVPFGVMSYLNPIEVK